MISKVPAAADAHIACAVTRVGFAGTIQHIANTNKAVEEAEHEKEAMEGTGEIEECEQIARDAARGEAVDESIERMEVSELTHVHCWWL